HSVEELRHLLTEAQETFDLADKEAREQPSPFALQQYRLASDALGDAKRALEIARRSLAE
ncbi:MAG: hypothetical protein HW403_992, partial [Dehalococcoidia bacterium]|nr:hypothetical protein [Dehalococcoidia bacterium]